MKVVHHRGVWLAQLFFSVMRTDIFSDIADVMGRSLFADDGALWRKGNCQCVVKRIQEGIYKADR